MADWFDQNAAPQQGAPQGGGFDPGNVEAFRAAWTASGGRTVDDLKRFVEANPQYGAQVTGSKGSKILFPNMQAFQAVRSAGLGGGIGAAWDDITGEAERAAAGGGHGGPMSGAYLTPYGQQFKLPTAEELKAMPGYQAALDAAMEGTQRSAAARGTLLTGGTQRALQQNAGDVASQMYGQLAGLKLGEMGFNRDTHYADQNNPFSKLMQTSQLGLSAANSAANNASIYSQNAQNNAMNVGNAQAAGTVGQANATTGAIGNLANTGLTAFNAWLQGRGQK